MAVLGGGGRFSPALRRASISELIRFSTCICEQRFRIQCLSAGANGKCGKEHNSHHRYFALSRRSRLSGVSMCSKKNIRHGQQVSVGTTVGNRCGHSMEDFAVIWRLCKCSLYMCTNPAQVCNLHCCASAQGNNYFCIYKYTDTHRTKVFVHNCKSRRTTRNTAGLHKQSMCSAIQSLLQAGPPIKWPVNVVQMCSIPRHLRPLQKPSPGTPGDRLIHASKHNTAIAKMLSDTADPRVRQQRRR